MQEYKIKYKSIVIINAITFRDRLYFIFENKSD